MNRLAARLVLLLAVGLTLLFAGCLAVQPLNSTGIADHTWRPITRQPEQAWLGNQSTLYTYVLVGDIGDGSENEGNKRAHEALRLVLREVQAGMPSSQMPAALLRHMNQFCIPAKSEALEKVDIETYNRKLAATYLAWFHALLRQDGRIAERLQGKGPFLIATREPLGHIAHLHGGVPTASRESPILVMDIADWEPKSAPYWVESFKKYVSSVPSETALIEPFKPQMVSWLLKMDRAIPFVEEAAAGTAKPFPKK